MDTVDVCRFTLNDESRWKSMSPDAIQSVCQPGANPSWPSLPPLCASSLDAALVSNDMEQELRTLVTEHRWVSKRCDCWVPVMLDFIYCIFYLLDKGTCLISTPFWAFHWLVGLSNKKQAKSEQLMATICALLSWKMVAWVLECPQKSRRTD